jgi:uncharacterized protein
MAMPAIEPAPLPGAGLGAPVTPEDRVFELDMLRGWAVLGILAVNAMAFAWPFELESATVHLPWMDQPANRLAHWVTDVFFHDKFRTLFSMLFGVSVFLVGGERSDETGGRRLRRRLFWLAVFGLVHGLALWFGDILMLYAWTGLFMMLCRSWPAGRLLWVGGAITAFFALLGAGFSWFSANASGEFAAQMQAAMPRVSAAEIQASVDLYRSGLVGALTENFRHWMMLQGASLVMIVWPTLGLMMVGLGLYKIGFLTGRAPALVYGLVALVGIANLALLGGFAWQDVRAGPDADPSHGLASVAASFPILITLAYASLLILLTRFGLKPVTAALAPVGRMAFTNYLTQSLIMATLFYMPWGPRLFGSVDQAGLWAVVAAIWIAQLIWSPLWLSVFRMGPLEWLWRCLTYGRLLPFRR